MMTLDYTYECLARTIRPLISERDLRSRLGHVHRNSVIWVWGSKLAWCPEQIGVLDELRELVWENGRELGNVRALSDVEQARCAELWLELILLCAVAVGRNQTADAATV